MSDDEVVAGIFFGLVGLISLFGWIWFGMATPSLAPRRAGWPIRSLAITPFLGVMVLAILLKLFADAAVRSSLLYQMLFIVIGVGWVGPTVAFSGWLGVSLRDDVWERRNPAAALAMSGLYLGIMLCYTGGNFGDGPGWWVVVISAFLATLGLYAGWAVVEWCAGLSELITVERDYNAGMRLAGLGA